MAEPHAHSQPIQTYGPAPHNRNIWPHNSRAPVFCLRFCRFFCFGAPVYPLLSGIELNLLIQNLFQFVPVLFLHRLQAEDVGFEVEQFYDDPFVVVTRQMICSSSSSCTLGTFSSESTSGSSDFRFRFRTDVVGNNAE